MIALVLFIVLVHIILGTLLLTYNNQSVNYWKESPYWYETRYGRPYFFVINKYSRVFLSYFFYLWLIANIIGLMVRNFKEL